MVFSEPTFLFFFLPVVLLCYFLTPDSAKNLILLCFSIIFYAWGEKIFVIVILCMILFNYAMGIAIANRTTDRAKNLTLAFGVAANLGVLLFFKYANFFASNLTSDTYILSYTAAIHLPIGISFFTFQALTYLVDLRRNEIDVQKNLVKLALYISLFPQLIAGPIVRYSEIEKALISRRTSRTDFSIGVERFALGLAKKVLIADPLGLVADQVFGIPADGLSTSVVWLGILCYSMQIFFDFSAYSDMAIGLGRIFGFKFPENFNYPYIARSVTDFWRRWHMTLSRWFKDYLYIPLGGNRVRPLQMYFNLAFVFIVCGFWHGASWNFILWGAYYGIFLVLEKVGLQALVERTPRALQHAYLLFIVIIGWVPFRAETLDQTLDFYQFMFGFQTGINADFYQISRYLNGYVLFTIVLAIIFSMPIQRSVTKFFTATLILNTQLIQMSKALSVAVLFVLAVATVGSASYSPFIYFRF
jgi:alginate O-acetyltransferase complex protein AlgI